MINHVRADLEFRIRKKRDAFSSKYKTFFETAVIEIHIDAEGKIKKNEIAKRNLIFIDNNYTYDASFWGNKNYIQPEQSIKEAINQINAKLKYKN